MEREAREGNEWQESSKGEGMVFGRNRVSVELKNPRTEVKRSVSDLFAPCRSIGPRSRSIGSLAIDRRRFRDRSAGCLSVASIASRSIAYDSAIDRPCLCLGELRDGDEPRSIASFGAIDRR